MHQSVEPEIDGYRDPAIQGSVALLGWDERPVAYRLHGGVIQCLPATGGLDLYLPRPTIGQDMHPQLHRAFPVAPLGDGWIGRCRVAQITRVGGGWRDRRWLRWRRRRRYRRWRRCLYGGRRRRRLGRRRFGLGGRWWFHRQFLHRWWRWLDDRLGNRLRRGRLFHGSRRRRRRDEIGTANVS